MKDIALQSDVKLQQGLNKLQSIKSKRLISNVNGRLVYDEKSGLLYDDEKGIYLEKDGKTSYTFPVFQLDPNEKIKNITFNKKTNNEYDIYIVDYDFSIEDTKNYSKEALAELEIKYQVLLKDGID